MSLHSSSPSAAGDLSSLPSKRQVLLLAARDHGIQRLFAATLAAFVLFTLALGALLFLIASSLPLISHLPQWALILLVSAITLSFTGYRILGSAVIGVREGWESAKSYCAEGSSEAC